MNAALGTVSAGGVGTPALDVTQVMLDQPGGSVGGVTLSKFSARSVIWPHGSVGGRQSWLLFKIELAVVAIATTAVDPITNIVARLIDRLISACRYGAKGKSSRKAI